MDDLEYTRSVEDTFVGPARATITSSSSFRIFSCIALTKASRYNLPSFMSGPVVQTAQRCEVVECSRRDEPGNGRRGRRLGQYQAASAWASRGRVLPDQGQSGNRAVAARLELLPIPNRK